MSTPALLTAFGRFGRWTENSSEHAARRQRGVAVRILPVDHEGAAAALDAALAETGARVLLMTGLADGCAPRLELRARRPAHVGEGPAERRGLWPWAAALDAVRATGAPVALSRDAGRYVCETTYWRGAESLDAGSLERGRPGGGVARAAFLHLPPLSPDWPAERLAAAVSACLAAGVGGV